MYARQGREEPGEARCKEQPCTPRCVLPEVSDILLKMFGGGAENKELGQKERGVRDCEWRVLAC
jgi:hypothetical protein